MESVLYPCTPHSSSLDCSTFQLLIWPLFSWRRDASQVFWFRFLMSCIPQVSSIVHNRLYNFSFEGTEGPIKTSNNIADDQKHGRRHWRYLATQELASLYYPLLGLSYALLGSPVLLISDRKMSQLLINSPLLRSSKECLIAVIGSFMFDTFCSSMWLVNYFFLLTIHSLVCNKLNKEVQVMSETLRYVSFNCVKLQDFDGNELTLQITEQCFSYSTDTCPKHQPKVPPVAVVHGTF